MSNIGFIGLGIMGRPMAKNLLKAGHQVTVYDIMPKGMDDVVSAGAQKGSSPKDVSSRTDIIITMVPDGPEVEQAVLGPNGVLDLVGNNINSGGTNNPAPFRSWLRGPGNGLVFEVFDGISGSDVINLTSSPLFPDSPTLRTIDNLKTCGNV